MLLEQEMSVRGNQRENKIIHKQMNIESALKSAVTLCKKFIQFHTGIFCLF